MDKEWSTPEERLMGEVNGHTAVLGRWLERLRDGDEAARSEVINHACQRLEALTRRMLRHYPRLRRWEQTGDVLQNAVLRLHRFLATVRPSADRDGSCRHEAEPRPAPSVLVRYGRCPVSPFFRNSLQRLPYVP